MKYHKMKYSFREDVCTFSGNQTFTNRSMHQSIKNETSLAPGTGFMNINMPLTVILWKGAPMVGIRPQNQQT